MWTGWAIFLDFIEMKIGHLTSRTGDEVTKNWAVSAKLGQVATTLTDTQANLSQS